MVHPVCVWGLTFHVEHDFDRTFCAGSIWHALGPQVLAVPTAVANRFCPDRLHPLRVVGYEGVADGFPV